MQLASPPPHPRFSCPRRSTCRCLACRRCSYAASCPSAAAPAGTPDRPAKLDRRLGKVKNLAGFKLRAPGSAPESQTAVSAQRLSRKSLPAPTAFISRRSCAAATAPSSTTSASPAPPSPRERQYTGSCPPSRQHGVPLSCKTAGPEIATKQSRKKTKKPKRKRHQQAGKQAKFAERDTANSARGPAP